MFRTYAVEGLPVTAGHLTPRLSPRFLSHSLKRNDLPGGPDRFHILIFVTINGCGVGEALELAAARQADRTNRMRALDNRGDAPEVALADRGLTPRRLSRRIAVRPQNVPNIAALNPTLVAGDVDAVSRFTKAASALDTKPSDVVS